MVCYEIHELNLYLAEGNIIKETLLAQTKDELSIVNDQIGCPTSANNIASVIYKISDDIITSKKNIAYGTYNY